MCGETLCKNILDEENKNENWPVNLKIHLLPNYNMIFIIT